MEKYDELIFAFSKIKFLNTALCPVANSKRTLDDKDIEGLCSILTDIEITLKEVVEKNGDLK